MDSSEQQISQLLHQVAGVDVYLNVPSIFYPNRPQSSNLLRFSETIIQLYAMVISRTNSNEEFKDKKIIEARIWKKRASSTAPSSKGLATTSGSFHKTVVTLVTTLLN